MKTDGLGAELSEWATPSIVRGLTGSNKPGLFELIPWNYFLTLEK